MKSVCQCENIAICAQPNEADFDVLHTLHCGWCNGEAICVLEDEVIAFVIECQRLVADLSTGLRNTWLAKIQVRRGCCLVYLGSVFEGTFEDDDEAEDLVAELTW